MEVIDDLDKFSGEAECLIGVGLRNNGKETTQGIFLWKRANK